MRIATQKVRPLTGSGSRWQPGLTSLRRTEDGSLAVRFARKTLRPTWRVCIAEEMFQAYLGMLRTEGPEVIRPLWVLQLNHICRLKSFRARDDFELDR